MGQENDPSQRGDTLHVRCNEELKQKARVEAAKAGKSMSEYVRDLLRKAGSGTTQQNKSIDTSDENPTLSIDSDTSDNGQVSDDSEPLEEGSQDNTED